MIPGVRLKQTRRAIGLTRARLSELSGISASHIANVENGLREPSLKLLVAVAPHVRTTALWLLTGEESFCPVCLRGGG